MSKNSKLSEYLFISLIVILVLSPLPFGSDRAWSESLLALASGLIMLIWCIGAAMRLIEVRVPIKRIRFIVIPYFLVVLWALAQVYLPFPEDWNHPIWQMTSDVIDYEIKPAISINPGKNLTGVMRLLCFGSAFWLALQFGRSERKSYIILKSLIVSGSIYAIYGLYAHLSGSQKILWFDKWAYQDSLTSVFVNRNSYATYAGIVALSAISYLLFVVIGDYSPENLREFAREFAGRFVYKGYSYFLAVVIIISALILTHSRAGLISFLIGSVALLVTMRYSKQFKPQGKWLNFVLIIAIPIVVALLVAGGDETFSRFSKLEDETSVRRIIYRTTLDIISDDKWLGTGLGTYEEVFRFYKGEDLPAYRERVDLAHNTYLELAVELGMPAALSLILSSVAVFLLCFRGIRNRRKNAIFPILALGVMSLVAFHALFDFSIQMPAIAFTYAVLIGLGCAQSWSSGNNLLEVEPKKQFAGLFLLFLCTVILLSIAFPQFASAIVKLPEDFVMKEIKREKSRSSLKEINFAINSRKTALLWQENGDNFSELAMAQLAAGNLLGYSNPSSEKYLGDAYNNLLKSLALRPAAPYEWLRLAQLGIVYGGSERSVANAVLMSIMTGPREYNILYNRLQTSLNIISVFDDEGYDKVSEQICIGWGVNKKRFMSYFAGGSKSLVCEVLREKCSVEDNSQLEVFCKAN